MDLSAAEIGAILRSEVKVARERYRTASQQFASQHQLIPTGIPYADSKVALQQSGQEIREALAQLQYSLTRLNEFIVEGVVPEDLAKLN